MLDREISVTVCGDDTGIRDYWVARFQRFFGGTTQTQVKGSWTDDVGIVWHEDNVVVSHIYDTYDPDFKGYQLDQLIREYKREANQQVVLVVEREVQARLI